MTYIPSVADRLTLLVRGLRRSVEANECPPLRSTLTAAADEIERLQAERDEMLEACRECLKVVDDAYEATGFIRVAVTSEQRMRIEAVIVRAAAEATT